MADFADNYRANHDAITATTQGRAPGIHILWAAIALTIFEEIESWVKMDSAKRMQKCIDE